MGETSLTIAGTDASDEESAQLRANVRSFCMGLIKALCQHSYYAADHPKTRGVCEEPFGLIKGLGRRWYELSFSRKNLDDDDKSVNLEGVFELPAPLERVINGPAGWHFARKLHAFCLRHHIISFSIKNYITDGEFRRFISIFVRGNVGGEAVRLDQTFTEQLVAADVYAVSVVLDKDVIRARGALPWRVRLALSRLRKDLTVLPMYRNATLEQLREAKLRIMQDILRPLTSGSFLAEFFTNLDLIADEIGELEGPSLERQLMDVLPTVALVTLGKLLVADRAVSQADGGEQRAAMLGLQLRALAASLVTRDDGKDWGRSILLRELFLQNCIAFDDLPAGLRAEMEGQHLVTQVMEDPHRFLVEFDAIDRADAYREHLYKALIVFAHLVQNDGAGIAEMIINVLRVHRQPEGAHKREPFVGRADLAAMCLNDTASPAVRRLIEGLANGRREHRREYKRLFKLVGAPAIPALIAALQAAQKTDVCDELALMLVDMAPESVPRVRATLAGDWLDCQAACYLLKVLERVRDRKAARVVERNTRHPEPQVRAAAIDVLVAIRWEQVSLALYKALSDEHPSVVVRAVRAHMKIDKISPGATLKFLEFLGQGRPPHHDDVQLAVLRVMARMGNIQLGHLGTLEKLLIQRFGKPQPPKGIGPFRLRKTAPDDPIRAAICHALSEIGGPSSLARMARYDQEPSPVVAERMKHAMQQLRQRLGGKAPRGNRVA